jgi:hypothetical protein
VKPAGGTPARVASASGATATLGARFRSELQKLYGQYTDHVGKRDPDNLNQRGFDQDTEDKLEQLFSLLAYGGKESVTRTKLADARSLLAGALKRAESPDGNDDKDCRETLEDVDQLLTAEGY